MESFQEVKDTTNPVGFQVDSDLQDEQDKDPIPTMDDMVQALQDVIGGIEDGDE